MDADADITGVAALLADPTRVAVAMLDALFDGRALSAGELARCARVTAPTASTPPAAPAPAHPRQTACWQPRR